MMNKLNREYNKYVCYQIYIPSFKDSNNDGIGDINGIISSLDYLKDLAIDLIWISPCFESPMDDNGYDVRDFYKVNSLYGNNSDLENLIKEVHKRDMKIILDLVLNHTSDEHEWFKKAKSDVNSKEHGYYFFKKGRVDKNGKRLPPNNWGSFFTESAWEYVEEIDEYYLHIFSKKMPDLNYGNEELLKRMKDVAIHWILKGIDGFRLDAIAHLSKDTSFLDSSLDTSKEYVLDSLKFSNRPQMFEILNEFSKDVFKKYNVFTIGEVGGLATPRDANKYANLKDGYINMVFNFDTCWANGAFGSYLKEDNEIKTNLKDMKEVFLKWYKGCNSYSDMPIYYDNHDHPRSLSQYGSIKYRLESSKMLITNLLYLYGVPFILNGDELGMSNVDNYTLEDFNDVNDINFRKEHPELDEKTLLRFFKRCSRINGRLPIPWKNDLYGGFSKVKPYIKPAGYYDVVNVEDELKDPNSTLNFYKKAIKLRKNEEILNLVMNGELEFIEIENENVFAYTHFIDKEGIYAISNFFEKEVRFKKHFKLNEILLHNYKDIKMDEEYFYLRPFESYLIRIQKND